MKQKLTELSQRYATALREHLKPSSTGSLLSAVRLGRQAVSSGLERPDLARIHQQALAAFRASEGRGGPARRAQRFFTEAAASIGMARRSQAQIDGLHRELSRCSLKLAAANVRLRRGYLDREPGEKPLPQSRPVPGRQAKEFLPPAEDLRRLAHRLLATQERKRQSIGQELRNEIAQALLGVHAALLAVQGSARGNAKNLKDGIAGTAQMVVKSARTVRRLALARGKV